MMLSLGEANKAKRRNILCTEPENTKQSTFFFNTNTLNQVCVDPLFCASPVYYVKRCFFVGF
jgi:hypothetical protein